MPIVRRSPTSDATRDAVVQSLRLSITRLARLLRQQDRTGLGPTLTAALASISRTGGVTHGELAALEQVAPPTITAVVGKMESLGLVTRKTDTRDRRITRIHITSAGRRQLDDVRNRRAAWLREQMDLLSRDEFARLASASDVLAKLTTMPPQAPS